MTEHPSNRGAFIARAWIVFLVVGACVLVRPGYAFANGGTIQISDQPAGPYRVTVMTSPSPLRVGSADVSIMVTAANSGAVVGDVTVGLMVTPEGAPGPPMRYAATHANAINKLYYAASVPFTQAGRYAFTIQVRGPKGGGDTHFDADVSSAFLGMTPFELTCTAIPVAFLIAVIFFTRRLKVTPPSEGGPKDEPR